MNIIRKFATCLLPRSPLVTWSVRNAYTSVGQKKRQSEISKEREEEARLTFHSHLSDATNFTKQQWDTFSEKLLSGELKMPHVIVNEANIDGVILRLCAQYRLFRAGMSYFEIIKNKKEPISDAALSRYLSLCSEDKEYALAHKQELIEIYKQLSNREIIEPIVAERCISVICLYHDHWRDCFNLLDCVKKMAEPTPSSYCSIIEACFSFGEIDLGWDLMRNIVTTTDFKPKTTCYTAYLDHCHRLNDSGKMQLFHLEALFNFLEEFALNIPSVHVVEKLKKLVSSLDNEHYKWSLTETFVPSRAGVCHSCRRALNQVKISSMEFEELSKTFIKKAVVGTNIFLKTTPHEIEGFKKFLAKSQPYDIVVDGLNVAYGRGARDLKKMACSLKAVVEHFVRRDKKVMVLGRRHMKNWHSESMNYIFKHAKVFLAFDLSQDDPLLLYATLKGGESTCFISRDMMKAHLFLLEEPRLKRMFKEWLVSHQYQLGYFDKLGQPYILPPLPYRPSAQKLALEEDEICWHLPYDDYYMMLPPDKSEPPPKWLCIRRVPRLTKT